MNPYPSGYTILNNQVKLVNRIAEPCLKGKLLRLSGSKMNGYTLYVVGAEWGAVLGTIATGNFKDIQDAINIFTRTIQII